MHAAHIFPEHPHYLTTLPWQSLATLAGIGIYLFESACWAGAFCKTVCSREIRGIEWLYAQPQAKLFFLYQLPPRRFFNWRLDGGFNVIDFCVVRHPDIPHTAVQAYVAYAIYLKISCHTNKLKNLGGLVAGWLHGQPNVVLETCLPYQVLRGSVFETCLPYQVLRGSVLSMEESLDAKQNSLMPSRRSPLPR